MDEKPKQRILFLSYDGLTDPLGQSQILPYLQGLSKNGFSISVISFEKKERFKNAGEKIMDDCLKNDIIWSPLPYHKKPPVLSTIFDLCRLYFTVNKKAAKNEIHTLHCRSYLTALIGLAMKKKHGVKFIFDMRGFWADERVEGGLWNKKNPIFYLMYRYFKNKEKQFLKNADHIVSLTENAKMEIQSWNIKTGPISVIPTCVDFSLFDPQKIKKENINAWRHHLGLNPNDFILLYLGSWGTWYQTDEMLDFFSTLKKMIPTAKFLIVTHDQINLTGFKDAKDVLVRAAKREEVPLFISLCQAGLCFIKPSFSKKASSATKLAEMLAMNIPVITNPGWGDIETLAMAFNHVKIVENAGDYESLILTLTTQREENPKFPLSRKYSLEVAIEQYTQIYSLLTTQKDEYKQ